MDRRISSVVLAGALALPLTGVGQVQAQARDAGAQVTREERDRGTRSEERETLAARAAERNQPQKKDADERSDQTLRDAITQLESTYARVHGSAHLYGGHRGRADRYIQQAIQELRAALDYEEQHEKKK